MTPLSIVLVLVSALLHSAWNFLSKKGNWPLVFFFWVFLWGTLFYLPFFFAFGDFPSFLVHSPPKLWWLVIFSGLFETVYFICLIEAYREGDLSLVYPISRSAPLFTQIWATLFIGEVLSGGGILGIAFVMIGLFVISLKGVPARSADSSSRHFMSRSYLLALSAAVASSIYSVIDKVGVQILHPVFYLWLINLWMSLYAGVYLLLRGTRSFLSVWRDSKKEILIIAFLQNVGYLLILMAMQMSKVSYVVAFRQVGALFGAVMGIVLLKEGSWRSRIAGVLILTLGLALIGLSK
jgi:drug/metabolite transporter (DMT)-like permease